MQLYRVQCETHGPVPWHIVNLHYIQLYRVLCETNWPVTNYIVNLYYIQLYTLSKETQSPWRSRYNWKIVESDIKHDSPKPTRDCLEGKINTWTNSCVIKWKPKNTTFTEKYQNQISKSQKEAKSIALTHKYMTAHVPVLVQALQYKVAGLN